MPTQFLLVCRLSDKLEVQTQKSRRISKEFEGAVSLQDAGMQTLEVIVPMMCMNLSRAWNPVQCTACNQLLHSSDHLLGLCFMAIRRCDTSNHHYDQV